MHSTKESGLRMAAGMDHIVEGQSATQTSAESGEDLGRVTVATELEPGQCLRLVKFLGYGWSGQRSLPAVRDQVEAALAAARRTGWRSSLPPSATSTTSGKSPTWSLRDAELQQAVRFALFHILEAGARAEAGDTGQGPHRSGLRRAHLLGHRDVRPAASDLYRPSGSRDALRWRHTALDLAREQAKVLGLEGASSWRTIRGQPSSGYWPASTAAFHINADIAHAVVRYRSATGDDAFENEVGLELPRRDRPALAL